MRRVTLIDAMADPNLFAPWFRDPASWSAWRAFLSALFALPMPDEQLAIYNRCTGRAEPPTAPAAEGWLVCGRRAGKSFILALIAVFLATFYDYRRYLAPGERGTVIVIATNTRQARVIFRYVRALLTGVPMLKRMIERETADTFDLTNGVTIEVGTTSFKTVRGYTIVAALCDELAFWPTDDSAEPDYEVLNALRPGMVTIPNAMLLCASSPYARRGALWDAHRRHFGKDGDPILVWHADTRTMNPTVPQRVIDEATERDPAWAAAEYGAQFRSDVESFVSREAVEACVSLGVRERAPLSGLRYSAFVDPSGGSADSMTLAVGHREDDCRGGRRRSRGEAAVLARGCGRRICRTAEALSHRQGHGRQIRRRMAARAIREARHLLRACGQAQVRSVSRPPARDQFAAGRFARSSTVSSINWSALNAARRAAGATHRSCSRRAR